MQDHILQLFLIQAGQYLLRHQEPGAGHSEYRRDSDPRSLYDRYADADSHPLLAVFQQFNNALLGESLAVLYL